MGKQAAPRRVADNEALAVGTTIRGSAQKPNLVAALIRGRKVEDAMNILAFSKKAMAVDVRKVLASARSEEHTSELQSLMRISYAVFCLNKKKNNNSETHQDISIAYQFIT